MEQRKLVLNKGSWKVLLVAIIIVVSDDTLLFGTNSNATFETLKYAILISILFILSLSLLRWFDLRNVSYTSVSCVVLCILVLLSGIINGDLRTGYFYKCIILILSCEFVKIMTLKDFAQIFEKFIFMLAVISVICTFIAEISLSVFSIFPVFYNSANTAFYNLGVYMIPTSSILLRNYGIFREPGVYQMFLILALIFHVYYTEKIKVRHLFIFILAIVLTFSTTGYIALLFFLILLLIKKNDFFSDNKKKYIIVVLIMIGILYMVTQTDLLSSEGIVFDKFSNMKRTTMIARFSSVFANLEIWKGNPLFGAGLITVSEMFPILSYQLYGKAVSHNTNTLLCELATYGVIYTGIIVYGYIKLSNAMSTRVIERILILLVIFILSCGEKLTFSPIIYILLFYGISFQKKDADEIESVNLLKERL